MIQFIAGLLYVAACMEWHKFPWCRSSEFSLGVAALGCAANNTQLPAHLRMKGDR